MPEPARERIRIEYAGRVQGVGLRHAVKTVATGYDVTGWVRNLEDGRVELVAEGVHEELEAFQAAIPEAGLRRLIKQEKANWETASGEFRGFAIIH